MLGKLIKYDFKSMMRSFVPLWIAFLVVSVINRFTIRLPDFDLEVVANLVTGVSMFLYVVLMVAINVIGIVLVIQRFYNGLLGDEGYLAFTLPVKPWQHVCSKGITGTVVIAANSLISAGSVVILAGGEEFFKGIEYLLDLLAKSNLNAGLLIPLGLLMLLITLIQSIYQIYAAMAIGHLMNNHRIAWSVGAYIGISTAISILSSIGVAIFAATSGMEWMTDSIVRYFTVGGSADVFWAVYLISLAITWIQLVAFYIITERILTKKLNLE